MNSPDETVLLICSSYSVLKSMPCGPFILRPCACTTWSPRALWRDFGQCSCLHLGRCAPTVRGQPPGTVPLWAYALSHLPGGFQTGVLQSHDLVGFDHSTVGHAGAAPSSCSIGQPFRRSLPDREAHT